MISKTCLLKKLSSNACKSNKEGKNLYELLNPSLQGVGKLFVLTYFVAAGGNADEEASIKDNKRYFLPRGEINNCKILIDGRNFYDQPINDSVKHYNEVRKVSTEQDDD